MNFQTTFSARLTSFFRISGLSSGLFGSLKQALSSPLSAIGSYYGSCLGRRVDNSEVLSLLNVQFAFLAVCCPADCPIWLRLAFCAWLAAAMKKQCSLRETAA